ncbi:hypothetical protein HEP81_04731 [Streptomyces griseofuscus]|uniref:Uncharacterized protein n=1 Tax=Streptomyces griseofuscus TaxID=146922 RepID=A0A7H1Q3X3_9ACTN|nr:hypothetical protein HEP81_04731 [Streptomyces griseofuscus]
MPMPMPMPTPPSCPACPDSRPLWKDVTQITERMPDNWFWYCANCERLWRPSAEHKEVFTHGPPGGSSGSVRRDPRMPRD